jgi:hypothetical protein
MTAWLKRFLPMCRNIRNRGADLMAEELSKLTRESMTPRSRLHFASGWIAFVSNRASGLPIVFWRSARTARRASRCTPAGAFSPHRAPPKDGHPQCLAQVAPLATRRSLFGPRRPLFPPCRKCIRPFAGRHQAVWLGQRIPAHSLVGCAGHKPSWSHSGLRLFSAARGGGKAQVGS